jgi:hypothetical protein
MFPSHITSKNVAESLQLGLSKTGSDSANWASLHVTCDLTCRLFRPEADRHKEKKMASRTWRGQVPSGGQIMSCEYCFWSIPIFEMRTTPSLTRHHCQGLAGRSSLMPLKHTERVHHEKWQAYKFRVPTTRSLSTLWATLLASKVTECMGWSYCSAGAVGWSEQCKLVRAIRWSLVSTQKS